MSRSCSADSKQVVLFLAGPNEPLDQAARNSGFHSVCEQRCCAGLAVEAREADRAVPRGLDARHRRSRARTEAERGLAPAGGHRQQDRRRRQHRHRGSGAGSASHLTMELLKLQAQLAIVHVPYRGFPPVVQDLLSGQIQATFAIAPAVLPNIKAGKLKGLAVTSAKRSPLAPEIPTVAEQGFPQFDATAWIGLLAPARVEDAVTEKLAAETQRIMRLPEVRAALGNQGFEVVGSTPEEYAG